MGFFSGSACVEELAARPASKRARRLGLNGFIDNLIQQSSKDWTRAIAAAQSPKLSFTHAASWYVGK